MDTRKRPKQEQVPLALRDTRTINILKSWGVISVICFTGFLLARFYSLEQRENQIALRNRLAKELNLNRFTIFGQEEGYDYENQTTK